MYWKDYKMLVRKKFLSNTPPQHVYKRNTENPIWDIHVKKFLNIGETFLCNWKVKSYINRSPSTMSELTKMLNSFILAVKSTTTYQEVLCGHWSTTPFSDGLGTLLIQFSSLYVFRQTNLP